MTKLDEYSSGRKFSVFLLVSREENVYSRD